MPFLIEMNYFIVIFIEIYSPDLGGFDCFCRFLEVYDQMTTNNTFSDELKSF